MLRLACNVATTRMILTDGAHGEHSAGYVIAGFAKLVMGGDFVIGVVVFIILLTVNFIVITKGASRIAEVGARFALDGIPGKQMAIDADLSSGLIDEREAQRRRRELEEESSFFGAMDGASKFVRGDAIAGLIITGVNVFGGILIATFRHGMPLSEAADVFTKLSVGDGLVTQIPALVVSTAAGLLVSKAGVSGAADQALMRQLSGYPKALGMSAGVMLVIAVLPGIPMLPFLFLGAGAAVIAWRADKRARAALVEPEETKAATAAAAAEKAEEPIANSLKIDDLKIEIGYGLLPLVNGPKGDDRLTEQIKALRRNLATEMGFVMPSVRILDNVQLEASTYIIKVKEVDAGTGKVYPGSHMVMDANGAQVTLPGHHTVEPTFGLPATWVDEGLREEAALRGYTVVDSATVLSTHLAEVLKANIADLLSYGEVQKLLKELPKEQAELVKDIVPAQISVSGIQRVLQLLLNERVSIRDLGTILEGIAEALPITRNPAPLVEHVRARIARQLCAQHLSAAGHLPLISLSPKWEQAFAESIITNGDDRSLAMQPSKLSDFVIAVRDRFEEAARQGEAPVLLTSPAARPFVRSIVERFRPQTPVMSQSEIHPRVRLKTVGSI
jgi:flagellar biosynthesis protein FlhA